MLLIERHQPRLRDIAFGDAVDAGGSPDDLFAAERGATVGELDERLIVVHLACLGDPDHPSGELTPEAQVSGDRLAAPVVPGDRAGPWHVPDDVLGE
jgi:hypothetical protein